MKPRELFRFDPRTILLVIVALNIVMFSAGFTGIEAIVRAIFTAIPAVMAIGVGRLWPAMWYLIICTGAIVTEQLLLASDVGGVGTLLAGLASLTTRLAPCFFLAYVAVVSIRSGELMAALEQWRVPRHIVIPLTVIFRFIPTVREELMAISVAMTARGFSLYQVGPGQWIEYRLVPLMISTVKTGEELTQAALTRALGKPGPVERIHEPTFRWYDAVLLLVCAIGVVIWRVG